MHYFQFLFGSIHKHCNVFRQLDKPNKLGYHALDI